MKKDSHNSTMTRRSFLGEASCSALGSAAIFSTLLNLRMAGRASAEDLPEGDDYKAIVCLFLAGGNDSFNMLVPRGTSEYAEYATTRSNLALAKEDLLPIIPATSDGREYGLHPSMSEMKSLFDSGNLSFLANVGTLVERPDAALLNGGGLRAAIRNGSYKLPFGAYSHGDQQTNWQTTVSDQRTLTGWGGRTADLLQSLNNNEKIGMGISLSGNNFFQNGRDISLYSITRNGSFGLRDFRDSNPNLFTTGTNSLLDHEYQNLLEQTYAGTTRNAVDAHLQFSDATENIQLTTDFPAGNLAAQLKMVAKTIAGRQALGMRRQTFFVEIGGWDFHGDVLNSQAPLLRQVSQAVNAFWSALGESTVDAQDKVMLFSASDFGRSLSSNGRGSDHAWGGNHFVLGGSALNGGDIYGDYPSLALGNNLDTGRGRLLPTTSVEEYFSELACWLGVPTSELATVFPNIGRFYTPGVNAPPLGFINLG